MATTTQVFESRERAAGGERPHQPPPRQIRYKRPPRPINFPVDERVPETKRHLELRILLYQILKTFGEQACIGSNQFVYWIANEPSRCL